jgi:hypothetical protein
MCITFCRKAISLCRKHFQNQFLKGLHVTSSYELMDSHANHPPVPRCQLDMNVICVSLITLWANSVMQIVASFVKKN